MQQRRLRKHANELNTFIRSPLSVRNTYERHLGRSRSPIRSFAETYCQQESRSVDCARIRPTAQDGPNNN